jgi:hypothetical protein
MEFKGTKLKWEVIIPTYEQTNGFVNISTEDGSITCYNGITKGGAHPKSLANALLISKAPKMLDFINRISGEMLRNDFVLDEKWYVQAEQLIKEATEI